MNTFQNYLSKEANLGLAKTLKVIIWALCAVVFALVGLMRSPEKLDVGIDFSFLPPVHAVLNSLVAFLLILAIVAIKKKNITLHKLSINAAMATSVLFLLCYVAYHFTTKETLFGDLDGDKLVSAEEKLAAGNARLTYFLFLASHIILAAISLPFICFTWMYGLTHQFKKHKKMAKWVFPVWLYVAITGPVCYFLLKPYY